MTHAIFEAMRASRTPEDFIRNHLLPALQQKRFHEARSSNTVQREETGEFDGIVFCCDNKSLIMTIGQRQKGIGEKDARLQVGNAFASVDQNAFDNAKSAYGFQAKADPHEGSSVHRIRIPYSAIMHGEWTSRIVTDKRIPEGRIKVQVNSDVFEELSHHEQAEEFLNRYLHTALFLNGTMDADQYLRRMKFDQPSAAGTQKAFYGACSTQEKTAFAGFIREMPRATTDQKISQLIEEKLGLAPATAKHYGYNIMHHLFAGEGRKKTTENIAAALAKLQPRRSTTERQAARLTT